MNGLGNYLWCSSVDNHDSTVWWDGRCMEMNLALWLRHSFSFRAYRLPPMTPLQRGRKYSLLSYVSFLVYRYQCSICEMARRRLT